MALRVSSLDSGSADVLKASAQNNSLFLKYEDQGHVIISFLLNHGLSTMFMNKH